MIIRFVIKFTPVCNGVRVSRSLVFCVMFCRSLFVLLYFLPRSLCCLSVLAASDCLFTSVIVSSVRPRGFWLSFYLGHCVVCPSSRLLIVFLPRSLCCLSVLAASDCLFTSVVVLSVRPDGFWLSFYLGHCVVCPSSRLLIVFLVSSSFSS